MGGGGAKSWTVQLGFQVVSPAHRAPGGYPAPHLSSSFLFHSYGEALEKLRGAGEKGSTVKSNSEAEKAIVGETEAKRGK